MRIGNVATYLLALKYLLVLAKTGALRLLLPLALAVLWHFHRAIKRLRCLIAPLAALAVAAACAREDDHPCGADSVATVDLEGSVRTLTAADTILINDPLGSLLAETNGRGEVQGRFASYPYGVTREDTTNETRRYTGATRDTAVGLDLMGARFYAPDLGIWTSCDPIAVNDPERSATEQFGTANPYAYANLNPVTATDPNGEFWHIAIGAGIGAVVGGGVEAARQYYATGHIEDWGRVGASAGGGAVSGAITAAVPTVGVATFFAVNAGSGVAGGVTQRLIASGGEEAGTLTDVIVDVGVGVATAGAFRGASAMIRRAAPARPAAAQIRALDSEAAFQRQYRELGRGAGTRARGFAHFFQDGRMARATELSADALRQGLTAQKATAGPLKFIDSNGVVRLTIKQGSARAPGSDFAHAEFRNAAGLRVDAFNNAVTRNSPANHTPIEFDLLQ